MKAASSTDVVVLATHARTVPADERQRFAVALRQALGRQGVILETCHRVEAFVVGDVPEIVSAVSVPAGGHVLRGESAIRHAVAVAVGRDSVVVGEDQILHQLRAAVDEARTSRTLEPALDRLFATALRSGRRARSWRTGPERSLATVAVDEIERRQGPLGGRTVLIVGAGRMARLAARAAARVGATLAIANRTADRAESLAREVGGEVTPFLPDARLAGMTAIVIAIGGHWSIRPGDVERLGDATVVDLSVPPAIDPLVAARLGGRLVSADDLARIDSAKLSADASDVRRLDALIDSATFEVLEWIEGHEGRAAAAALAERADAARRAELEALWRRLPDLDADSRAAIETMTRHFSDRLLREPLERLGSDRDGRAERAVREMFAL